MAGNLLEKIFPSQTWPGDQALDWLRRESRQRGLYIELAGSEAISRHLQLRKGVVNEDSTCWTWDLGIRVLDGQGREGLASASIGDWDWGLLGDILDQASAALKCSAGDPWRIPPCLADYQGALMDVRGFLDQNKPHDGPRENRKFEIPSVVNGPGSDESGFRQWFFLMKDWEAALLKHPQLNDVLEMSLESTQESWALFSSFGLRRQELLQDYSWSVSLVAGAGTEVQNYGAAVSSPSFESLLKKVPRSASKAAGIATGLLGARRTYGGRYPVIFDPWLMQEILSLLSSTLCADEIMRGFSPWRGRLEEMVASPLVTLVDDGAFLGGSGTSSWDDEGLPTQETTLIRQGALQGFLCDLKSARQMGSSSTANASRNFSGAVSPAATNFYLKAGAMEPQAILCDTKRGIYLVELQGIHTVDTATGDFSLGGAGFWVENGERAWALQELTVAGNIFDMLKRIDAVGSDLKFEGPLASPTVRVTELDIGGENRD
ncbi:MAG: TldD/PmbA family protein [Elusimicrobia bacterium]|nr:TldD/PmbA family protein [Elusimicrobiota bacterium]